MIETIHLLAKLLALYLYRAGTHEIMECRQTPSAHPITKNMTAIAQMYVGSILFYNLAVFHSQELYRVPAVLVQTDNGCTM